MKITNLAKIPYEVIGQIIDKYINDGYGDTLYYGKIDTFKFGYEKEIYKVTVRYLKRYVDFMVENGDKE